MARIIMLKPSQGTDLKKTKNLSFADAAGKAPKFSDNTTGLGRLVSNHRHAKGKLSESEGRGSPEQVEIEHSCAPKTKCIRLNILTHRGFNIPSEVFDLSKMSKSQRKELGSRLKADLQKIQAFEKKLLSRMPASANGTSKKGDFRDQDGGSHPKQCMSGRFEWAKGAPRLSSCKLRPLLMKECEALLKSLMSHHRYDRVFNAPVDIVNLKIPDYYHVIKKSMDMGTIRAKMASGSYSPRAFADDVRLTFTNALTNNPPGSEVHIMADTMRKVFEARWKLIEKKLAESTSGSTLKRKAEEEEAKLVQPSKNLSNNDVDVSSQRRARVGAKLVQPSKKRKLAPTHDCTPKPDYPSSSGRYSAARVSSPTKRLPKSLDLGKIGAPLTTSDNNGEKNDRPDRQVSPEKLYRAAMMRNRFADTILKALEKTLDEVGEKVDPEKLRRQREELERQQKQERARLQAEAKAAEAAKRRRELEREAARQSLLKIEKTAEIGTSSLDHRDLEMLVAGPATECLTGCYHIVGQSGPGRTLLDRMEAGEFVECGRNLLEKLGLFRKDDYDEEDEDGYGSLPTGSATVDEIEEGEIR